MPAVERRGVVGSRRGRDRRVRGQGRWRGDGRRPDVRVIDRGVVARRVRVVRRLLHRVAAGRARGRVRLRQEGFRRRDAGRGRLIASRRHEDRDDRDDDGDHDEHEADPPVPLAGGHRALDLLALEPGLLASFGLGHAAPVVGRAASLVGSGHVGRTSSRSSGSFVGSASLPTEPRLRRVGAVPMLMPAFPAGPPAFAAGMAYGGGPWPRPIKIGSSRWGSRA